MTLKKLVLAFAFLLSACGQFTPFVDAHREAGQVQLVGQSTSDKVAVCYNPIWSDESQVKELADQECAKTNRNAVYDKTTRFSCRLVNPSTAFYDCQKS